MPLPAEYTFTHYQLPEPEGVVWSRPIPTYIWLLCGAATFAIVAIFLSYLQRRAAQARTATS
jgi:hypothetical protein